MPLRLKLTVIGAKSLPIMDKTSKLADPYVEVRLGESSLFRTDVARKTLQPMWNASHTKEITDDKDLQDMPLLFRVWDHDVVSADDVIGVVHVSLDSLLTSQKSTIKGWFPIYDTLRGLCGQLGVVIKLTYIEDDNPLREGSASVMFLSSHQLSSCLRLVSIVGFVEELRAVDDPEYNWVDTFRTARTSNEARQLLFYKMSGLLRRHIGRKVRDLGGNAVVGYCQAFDLENKHGNMVARAYGTACILECVVPPVRSRNAMLAAAVRSDRGPSVTAKASQPTLSEAPSLVSPSASGHGVPVTRLSQPSRAVRGNMITRGLGYVRDVDPLAKVHLITLRSFPEDFRYVVGGLVATRVVKIIKDKRIQAKRLKWWMLVRTEIMEHAGALGCNCVLGYTESTAIRDGAVVLSAVGTAAKFVRSQPFSTPQTDNRDTQGGEDGGDAGDGTSGGGGGADGSDGDAQGTDADGEGMGDDAAGGGGGGGGRKKSTAGTKKKRKKRKKRKRSTRGGGDSTSSDDDTMDAVAGEGEVDSGNGGTAKGDKSGLPPPLCGFCHVPYGESKIPFSIRLVECGSCHSALVPELLLTTINPPIGAPMLGSGGLIQAEVARKKKGGKESWMTMNEAIPFVEYDLHRQLTYKLKLRGMNAVFNLRIHLSVGPDVIVGSATGTAVCLLALPRPPSVRFVTPNEYTTDESRLRSRLMDDSRKSTQLLEEASKAKDQASSRRASMGVVLTPSPRGEPAPVSCSPDTAVFTVVPAAATAVAVTAGTATATGTPFSGGGGGGGDSGAVGAPAGGDIGGAGADASEPAQVLDATGAAAGDVGAVGDSMPERVQTGDRGAPASSDSGPSSLSTSVHGTKTGASQGEEAAAVPFVIEIGDDSDRHLLRSLQSVTPVAATLCNTERLPGYQGRLVCNRRLITMFSRHNWGDEKHRSLTDQYRSHLKKLYQQLMYSVGGRVNLHVCGVETSHQVADDSRLEVFLIAMAVRVKDTPPDALDSGSGGGGVGGSGGGAGSGASAVASGGGGGGGPSGGGAFGALQANSVGRSASAGRLTTTKGPTSSSPSDATDVVPNSIGIRDSTGSTSRSSHHRSNTIGRMGEDGADDSDEEEEDDEGWVEVTPLAQVPGRMCARYLGRVNVHVIRERFQLPRGLGHFMHALMLELHALLRAHAVTLGGNAVVSYHLDELRIFHRNLRNQHQAYCFASASGDAVQLLARERVPRVPSSLSSLPPQQAKPQSQAQSHRQHVQQDGAKGKKDVDEDDEQQQRAVTVASSNDKDDA